jgi:hypothetical protein
MEAAASSAALGSSGGIDASTVLKGKAARQVLRVPDLLRPVSSLFL